MDGTLLTIVKTATSATEAFEKSIIQNLWSGYGKIIRVGLKGSRAKSVIVKHIRWPTHHDHPVGWNTDISHERKVHSYKVESAWYRTWSHRCDETCRVPRCLAVENHGEEVFIVLEDLDASGYPFRKSRLNRKEIDLCLNWLANFHATFIGQSPDGLWPVGTYWHLETRQDELNALEDTPLRDAAIAIDKKLNETTFSTFVHGDAKVANFCFSRRPRDVAAVDFQYVGGGCGMKDVAYFLGSCLYEDECERLETELLDTYFAMLTHALKKSTRQVAVNELIKEWRELYHWAWTDFHRFIKGWSSNNWYTDDYSERLKKKIIAACREE